MRASTSELFRLVWSVSAAALLMSSAGCVNSSHTLTAPSASSSPQPAAGGLYHTAPVSGVVTDAAGQPLAEAGVILLAAGVRQVTGTDATGQFSFPSVRSSQSSATLQVIRLGFSANIGTVVPTATDTPPPAIRVTLPMQPRVPPLPTIRVGQTVEFSLTDADGDLGSDADRQFGLPGLRGPAKMVYLDSLTGSPVEIRAEWSTDDPLHLWAEVYYRELSVESMPAAGQRSATLVVPGDWTGDVLNRVGISFGLPGGMRASGGLSAPTTVRLTARALR